MTATQGIEHGSPLPDIDPATGARRRFRSRTNRTFAGVCGGIAEYCAADTNAVRLLTIVLAVVTGIVPMLVLYMVAAIVIPERAGDDLPSPASAAHSRATPGQGGLIVGLLLVGVGVAALANEMFRIDWDLAWPIVLVVVGGFLVVATQRR